MAGTRVDGSPVNLNERGAPLRWERPLQSWKGLGTMRQSSYLFQLNSPGLEAVRPAYARWRCRVWNQQAAPGEAPRPLANGVAVSSNWGCMTDSRWSSGLAAWVADVIEE